MSRPPTKTLTAWGQTKLLVRWLEDPRCPDLSHAEVCARLQVGWTPEQALSTPITPEREITGWGETRSLIAWAEDERCVVSVRTLRRRLEKGVDPEVALTLPPVSGKRLPR